MNLELEFQLKVMSLKLYKKKSAIVQGNAIHFLCNGNLYMETVKFLLTLLSWRGMSHVVLNYKLSFLLKVPLAIY